MTIDLMFLAWNRLEFTRESLRQLRRNTDWSAINKFVIYDDGSTDGTLQFLQQQVAEMGAELRQSHFGSAVTAQSHFIENSSADFLAKCDNDAMYPPDWLNISIGVLNRHPELQVVHLEERSLTGDLPYTYEGAAEGDGLFVARGDLFRNRMLPTAINKYWGWETWMLKHHVQSGWLRPSIPVFLLDRVPIEPWASLSVEYQALGWQRPLHGSVHRYTVGRAYLWSWCGWEEKAAGVRA